MRRFFQVITMILTLIVGACSSMYSTTSPGGDRESPMAIMAPPTPPGYGANHP